MNTNPKDIDKKKRDDTKRKEQLKFLEKIDNKRIIQNNHVMVGDFDEAINIAKEIISLADDAKLQSIVEEQEEFINQILSKITEKDKISKIKESFKKLKTNFNKLIKNKEIVEAHTIVEQFKQKHNDMAILRSMRPVMNLLSIEREIWIDFTDQQEAIKAKLKHLDNQFHRFLEKDDIVNTEETMLKAKKFLPDLFEKDFKIKWNTYEKELIEHKRKNQIIEKIKKTIQETLKDKQNFSFDDALLKIDDILKLIENEVLPVYKEILVSTKKEIIAAEIKYKKLYLEFAEWKSKLRVNQENNFLNAAISNCRYIIPISREIGMSEEENNYKELLKQLEKKLKDNETADLREKQDLIKDAEEIKKLITLDENILPLIEEFNVKDLLGDLSEEIEEKLEQVGSLLDEHRVEVKKEITSSTTFSTTTGEIIENKQEREIQKIDGNEEVKYAVNSNLKNRTEDIIENAIITDLIPYNYEISEITYNGEIVNNLPGKSLKKEGLELQWNVGEISPKEGIMINYNLRRRVSRTIIFILKGQLKIIKTHSNLNKGQYEGLYEAKLPFKNLFGLAIDGVVIEDIIPLYYVHFVEQPTNLLPKITAELEMGDLFKWNIGAMKEETIAYHYKLLEIYRFEEIKINIRELNTKGLEDLEKGDFLGALEKYKEIRNLLISNVK
ncbi:MAG: hypothetical protein ACTSQD_01045 [Promethearchaeota archaeon]